MFSHLSHFFLYCFIVSSIYSVNRQKVQTAGLELTFPFILLLLLLLFLLPPFGFMSKVCFHPVKLVQFSMNGNAIKCSNLVEKKGNWKTHFLYALFFAGFLALNFQVAAGKTGDGVIVTKADYQALRAFKSELIDFKGVLRSWNDSGFGACSGGWVGIKCVNGRVIAIQLPWKGLGGRISEKIGSLKELRKLSLHDNLLSGTVPSSLGILPKLRGVYLFNNRLSGSIPPSIGRSSVFQTLDLSNNSLSGTIPPALTNSTRLYRLNLSYNSLSGLIPASLTRSPSLTILALNHNNLSGQIPNSWGGSGNESYRLQFLTLDHNHLSGSIPISVSKLSWIEEISLSHNELSGSLPSELGKLTHLRLLDLSTNTIQGTLPDSFFNLSSLVSLNLESNRFKDQIPDSFVRLKNLSTINLKNNQFYGEIPAIIGNISVIKQLDFSQNNLTGEIPASLGSLANLTFFNVSYNNLSGPVPLALSNKFNSSSFTGNLQLCGYSPSLQCPSVPQNLPAPPPEASTKHRRKLSTKDIILIAAGALIVFLLLFCCILVCCLVSKKKKGKISKPATSRSSEKAIPGGAEIESGHAGGKLVHFDGPFVFTADDLLCATAEIMGKSTYGTAYKATLEDDNVVAVKRLREKTTKGEKEFEHEVAEIGKIRHPNLLSLSAYYLGPKGEKLLVYDYMANGSLASFLHARGPESLIDWATRMKIAVGITRGLSYLHTEDINIIHGNLTSSNILLDEKTNAHIADFGLSRLMTSAANTNVIATAGTQGYNAPELSKAKKTTSKTDIYSLGVIILELLTGKSPGETMNGMDLPQWVASTVKGERTNEVFDLELMRDTQTIGDELLNTLKLALHCVDPSPDARPDVQQVLQQLEKINPEMASVSVQDDAHIPSSNT